MKFLEMAGLTCLIRDKTTNAFIKAGNLIWIFFAGNGKQWVGDLWVFWLKRAEYGRKELWGNFNEEGSRTSLNCCKEDWKLLLYIFSFFFFLYFMVYFTFVKVNINIYEYMCIHLYIQEKQIYTYSIYIICMNTYTHIYNICMNTYTYEYIYAHKHRMSVFGPGNKMSHFTARHFKGSWFR